MERQKKILRIIKANKKHGTNHCAKLLNDGGFPAPCGRKYQWKPEYINRVAKGEDLSHLKKGRITVYTLSAAVPVEMYDIVIQNSNTASEFVRAAISEKIERDGLTAYR